MRLVSALACSLLAVACSKSDDAASSGAAPSDDAGADAALDASADAPSEADAWAPPDGATIALYGPAKTTTLTPYPSNRYTTADATTKTGLRVDVSASTTTDTLITLLPDTAKQLSELDGFSTVGGAYASFSAPIDKTVFARDAGEFHGEGTPLAIVNVDPASPDVGKAVPLIPLYSGTTADGSYYLTSDYTVLAQPAVPLLPHTKYLFVVTDRVKDESGGAVWASDDTHALLDGSATDAYAIDVRAALDAAAGVGAIAKDHVVLATVFTTASTIDEMTQLAKDRRASTPSALVGDLTVHDTSTTDDRVRFLGHYTSPEYRSQTDGHFVVTNGAPEVQGTPSLEFYLSFSDKTFSGKRPIVIFAHGLGDTKEGTWGTTERMAPLNAAVFGIDAPFHGSRSPDPSNPDPVAAMMSYFGVDLATKQFDLEKARDNFRQMGSDQLELVRFIRTLGTLDVLPVGAPDGVPDLDVDHILYIGHSFGSVQGPLVAAEAPEIEGCVWNVGGDGLTTLLRDSGTFRLLVNAMRPAGTPDSTIMRFFAIAQAVIDPGDPLNYARFVSEQAMNSVPAWRARHVLLQEADKDSIVPNITSELLARAAGLSLIAPDAHAVPGMTPVPAPLSGNGPNGATCGLYQFSKADGQAANHGGLIFTDDAIGQYVPFFRSVLDGHPVITDPFAGRDGGVDAPAD